MSSKSRPRVGSKGAPPRSCARTLLGVLLVLLLTAAIFEYEEGGGFHLKDFIQDGISFIEAKGENALFFYFAFTLVGVILLFPTTIMEFSGGFLFASKYGLLTTLAVTVLAKFLATAISIAVARQFFKDWIQRNVVAKSELLMLVAQAVKEEPYKMAFLVRGSMASIWVKNYGLAVMDIGYLPIACCSLIFTPFYAFQNIYFGSLCQDLKEVFSMKKDAQSSTDLASQVKTLLPIVFNVLLVIFLVRAIKNQLRKSRVAIEERLKEVPRLREEPLATEAKTV